MSQDVKKRLASYDTCTIVASHSSRYLHITNVFCLSDGLQTYSIPPHRPLVPGEKSTVKAVQGYQLSRRKYLICLINA